MAEVPGPAMLVILASISSMKARRRQWENGSGRSMWTLTSCSSQKRMTNKSFRLLDR